MRVLSALVRGQLLLGQEEEVVVELPTKADELLDPGSSLVDLAGHQLQLRVGAAKKLHLVIDE